MDVPSFPSFLTPPAASFATLERMERLTSLIVPAFNEADHLEADLNRLDASLSERFGSAYEVIVVNDGSSDATGNVLAACARKLSRVRIEEHERNLGLDAAVRTGIAAASGDRIAVLDADLTYDPHTVGTLVDAVDRGADIAVASAYMRGGSCRRVPFVRLQLSRWANRYLSLAVNGRIRTLTCLVRAYDGAWARRLLASGAFTECTFGVLLAAYRDGARIVEVPACLDWSAQPRQRARRLALMRASRHAWDVLVAGVRTRPMLLAAIPGLIPGLLPAVVAAALVLRVTPGTLAAATLATIVVQYASLALFSYQLGDFVRRTHVQR
ncbi:MAG: glycosyltransferase family 2 protein [bacterium]|nr:glycosyltransferase family 2 protein [bacterium]